MKHSPASQLHAIKELLLSFDENSEQLADEFAKACKNGDTNIVILLLEDGRIDPYGNRNDPLFFASKHGHEDIVKLLLNTDRVDFNDKKVLTEVGKQLRSGHDPKYEAIMNLLRLAKPHTPPSIDDEDEQNMPRKKALLSTKSKKKGKKESDLSSEKENYVLNGKSIKTLELIFDNNPKVKFVDMEVLTKALGGIVTDEAGGSSRKLHLHHQTVFLHERHNRDRADYVDPNAIKDMKKMLQSFGVTPETPFLDTSKLESLKTTTSKKSGTTSSKSVKPTKLR